MTTVNNKNGNTREITWMALFSKGNGLKAVALALGVMLHATNVYLATTIMPSIIKEIGGLEYYAWNTTIFVVASVVGSVLSANRLATYGPRKAYQMGILVFTAGTLICTFTPSMTILLIGRSIQGLGGGLLFALSYAMIRLVFEEKLWSRAMALISGMWGIAAFSGPFLGGVFAENAHWRWAFGFLLLFCLIIYSISTKVLPQEKTGMKVPSIPYLKLVLLGLATLSVSIGSLYENLAINIGGIFVGFVFLGLLVSAEKRKGTRLLPTNSYKFSGLLSKTYVVMALLTIATSIEIYIPYFSQVIYNYSPLESGYLTVLIAIGWTFSSLLFSGYSGKVVGRIILTGAFLMFVGLLGLAYIAYSINTDILSSLQVLLFTCLCLLTIGAGIGMGWPHLLTRVFSLAPKGEEELTSSSVTTVQLIAMSFGASLAGVVVNLGGISTPGGIEGAVEASTLLYSLFALTPFAAVIILLVKKKK